MIEQLDEVDPALPPGHAEIMVSSLEVILGARRLILDQRARRGGIPDHEMDPGWERVEKMANLRDAWALRCQSDDTVYWITAYSILSQQRWRLRESLGSDSPDLTPPQRSEILLRDIPMIDRQLAALQDRLKVWRQINLRPGQRRSPAPGPRSSHHGGRSGHRRSGT